MGTFVLPLISFVIAILLFHGYIVSPYEYQVGGVISLFDLNFISKLLYRRILYIKSSNENV